MSEWFTTEGRLSFSVPDTSMIEHAAIMFCIEDDGPEYDGAEDREEWWADGGNDSGLNHRVWWWEQEGCDGEDCSCGHLTLLAALEYLDPGERGSAIRLHAEEMRALYEHFWAGQGLVSGASRCIGEACADCIVNGAVHVWDVYSAASEMAEEFGEALAAYAYELFVGEPRHTGEQGD